MVPTRWQLNPTDNTAVTPKLSSLLQSAERWASEQGLGYLCFPWTGTCNNFHMAKETLLRLSSVLDCTFGVIHVFVQQRVYLVSVLQNSPPPWGAEQWSQQQAGELLAGWPAGNWLPGSQKSPDQAGKQSLIQSLLKLMAVSWVTAFFPISR